MVKPDLLTIAQTCKDCKHVGKGQYELCAKHQVKQTKGAKK